MKNSTVTIILLAVFIIGLILFGRAFYLGAKKNPADKIFYGGTIITMKGNAPEYVQAVAISADKIIFVGSKKDTLRYKSKQTELIDLKGKTLLPGFIEPHMHHALAGAFYFITNIRADEDWGLPGIKAKPVIGHDEFIFELKNAEAQLKDPEEWLIVAGYASYYHGKIDKTELEKVSTTRPILLFQRSGHEAFLNDKALEVMGFTAENTKGIEGIDFTKGHFVEAPIIERIFPKVLNIILRGDRWESALHKSVEYLHKNGITTAADMLAIDGFNEEQVKQFHEIIDASDISFRTYMVAEPRLAFEKGGAAAAVKYIDDLSSRSGKNLIYLKQAKGFVDGAFFAQLMRLKGGYTDGHRGEWITPPDELEKIVTVFWNKSYPLHIHVNGDEGLDSILATLAKLKKASPDSKSRVTFHHLGYARPDQIKKMKQLGICASILPYYLHALGDIYSTHGLGPERASYISRAATCLKNGAIISLHSDFPMAPSNPLYSAWIAVNRIGQISGKVLGPEERISVYEALRAITIDAAYTLSLENEIGSIKRGKKADFTILAEDPLKVDPLKLKDIKIVGKVFNGKYYELNK